MLKLAAKWGEKVMPLPQWQALAAGGFDGAIAVFVLHYGVPDADLASLASQLRNDGRFAASYFKPPQGAIAQLASSLAANGMRIEREEPLERVHFGWTRNVPCGLRIFGLATGTFPSPWRGEG